MVALFLFSYGQSLYQLDYWQQYFFENTVSFGQNCQVRQENIVNQDWNEAADATHASAWKQIKVPHLGIPLPQPKVKDLPFVRVTYECKNKMPQPSPSMGYIHLGWVFGDAIRIFINDTERLSFVIDGGHKPIIGLKDDDLKRDTMDLRVEILTKPQQRTGIEGAADLVLAPNEMVNSKLLALEVSLNTVRYLFTLLPVLVLGLILVYGWFNGIRSRMMLVTLFFFSLTAAKNSIMVFSDLFPWNAAVTYVLATPFTLAIGFSFWFLIAEGFSLWRRSILVPMVINSIALLAILAVMYFSKSILAFSSFINYTRILLIIAGLVVLFAAIKAKLRFNSDSDWSKSYFYLMVTLAVTFWGGIWIDTIALWLSSAVRVSPKMEYILPLAVGCALIQNLSQINRKYERERKTREKMETDLETAREIQDSIAPPEISELFESYRLYCYQIKYDQVAGDWMGVRATKNGILALVADATGKGVQAALVVHALQSLWAAEMDNPNFAVEAWLQKVNKTLLSLGKKRPHSMTMGLFLLEGKRLTYWSAGHLPLYVASGPEGAIQLKSVNARGTVIGLHQKLELKPESIDLSGLENVSILLGSDGVFEKGTRTGRRELLRLFQAIRNEGEGALKRIEVADDRTVILVKQEAA